MDHVYEAIRLAQIHAERTQKPMRSSALLRAQDAVVLYNAGEDAFALHAAVESLAYSVGVFHDDYKRAAAKR